MMKIGTGKGDITAFYENAAMLGYAMYHHIMKGVETPLYARTFVFENGDNKVGFVNCELGFITPALKKGVLLELTRNHSQFGYTNENLLISAQHTHCAPGGYSYYSLYNTAVPGFIREVYEKIVSGIVDSIVEAEGSKRQGKLTIGYGNFEPETTISFNRSIKAYNMNEDVEPLPFEKRHLAVDRSMVLLKAVDEHGTEIGSINWFAVHTTSLPNNFYKVCSDNKGYASTYLEEEHRRKNPGYLGIFAQGNCGDVSPRWIFNPRHKFQRGKYEGRYSDDLLSTQYSGKLQFEKALEISRSIPDPSEGAGEKIDCALTNVHFGLIDIEPDFTNGIEGCVTSPACMGVAMLEGSKYDGPGMHPIAGFGARLLSRFHRATELWFVRDQVIRDKIRRKQLAQGVKDIALESETHRLFMAKHARRFFLPGFVDETIRNMKIFDRNGAYTSRPWTPQILPLQIIRLGNIVICGIPFEITTVAGKRLKQSLENKLLGKDGIEHIILCPYSNAYSGYITTNEEYQVQMYEAGHCVFGQWSLNALTQEMDKLAGMILKPLEKRDLPHDILPPDFTDEEIDRIRHFESLTARREMKKNLRKAKRNARHTKVMNRRVLKGKAKTEITKL